MSDRPAPIDLRPLAERVAAGDEEAAEELRRVVAELRAKTVVTPAEQPGPPTPEWRERFHRAVETLRASVPEEWDEEEIARRVEQAVTEVRADRARRR